MAYVLNKSNNDVIAIIEDGQVDSGTTSITFVGKNYVNYGEIQNENFLFLLENFARNTPPNGPIPGQLWYQLRDIDKNLDVNRIKVRTSSTWASLPKFFYSTASTTAASLDVGDFWWDETNEQLKIRSTASEIVLVGGKNFTATYALQLVNQPNINGVKFTGTASITVSSTTTNYLVGGDYITGNDFNGSTTTTWSVDVGTVTQPTASKVVARDNNGSIYFNVGYGTATSARYADLAEKYLADQDYEPGTVVVVGGKKEVTACQPDERAIGVVSTNPALMMNSELDGGTYIALKGRVPVKVTGNVLKKQYLEAGPNGTAVASNVMSLFTFAIALENSNNGVVEAVIL